MGDDFGDVYGLLLAVTGGDGYSLADLDKYATDLKRELSLVPGVARVAFWGVQDRRIYLDASLSQLTQLGISEASLERALDAAKRRRRGGLRSRWRASACRSLLPGSSPPRIRSPTSWSRHRRSRAIRKPATRKIRAT